jgi:hypothetical protein
MTDAPSATTYTVLDVLHEFDADFAAVAMALENGEFALWVGSGISGKAPSLGGLIRRAIEFLRTKAVDPVTNGQFRPALIEALRLAEADPVALAVYFNQPFCGWPECEGEEIAAPNGRAAVPAYGCGRRRSRSLIAAVTLSSHDTRPMTWPPRSLTIWVSSRPSPHRGGRAVVDRVGNRHERGRRDRDPLRIAVGRLDPGHALAA